MSVIGHFTDMRGSGMSANSKGATVHLDADDLLKQIQQDWPLHYEVSVLRAQVARQQTEIERLTAVQPLTYNTRSYGPEETRADLTLS